MLGLIQTLSKNIKASLNNQNMNTITINGRSISVSGSNVSVINGKIFVDEKLIEEGLSGDVHVKWEGDLASLKCNSCDITGNVAGNVNTNEIKCGNVGGDVKANEVKCGNVSGSIKANSVKYRKAEDTDKFTL